MILCGNIFLDELNKTFSLICVLCKNQYKRYADLVNHIRNKHKELKEKEASPIRSIVEKINKNEEDSLYLSDGEEKSSVEEELEIKNEMEVDGLEEFIDDSKYVDPILAMEKRDSLAIDKHKELEEKDASPPRPIIDKIKNEDSHHLSDDGGEKSNVVVEVEIKNEIEVDDLEEFTDDIKYDDHVIESFVNPIYSMDERDSLNALDAFDSDLKDENYAPDETNNDSDDEDYQDEYGKPDESDSDTEVAKLTVPTDKFTPTFYRKKRFLNDFIDLYKSQPVLWDINGTKFKNTKAHKEAEIAIITGMQKFNIYLKTSSLKSAINNIHKYCNIIKTDIENGDDRKVTTVAKEYYERCDFLKDLLEMKKLYTDNNVNIGELPFPCEQCEKRFSSQSSVKCHVIRVHSEKKLTCKFCEKSFRVPSELRTHTFIHTAEKPHVCELCGKGFRLRYNMNLHINTIHTNVRAFKCNMCTKDFKKKRQLTEHVKNHLYIRDKICETCGKSYSNLHSLIRHRLVHSDIKRYPCKLCDLKFHQLDGLNGHMKRIHIGKKDP